MKHDGHSHHSKGHIKHGHHPHDKMAATEQFKDSHWEKNAGDVEVAGGRYSSEFNQKEEYTKDVDDLARYVKKHRAEH